MNCVGLKSVVDRSEAAGGFNWRGGEGSVTDRVAEDLRPENPITGEAAESRIFSSYTRPSTGRISG